MDKANHIHSHKIGKISTALSVLCAIHCAATPVLVIFLPFLGNHSSDWFEIAMIVFIIILGGSSILHGLRGHHHNKFPAIFFGVGVILMITGLFLHSEHQTTIHTVVMVTGGIFSAIGQIYNLKLSHF
ncbi:MAG: MerC domain-containing protein [Chitinophagales bacterium]|nr:MerC domain-containing protein [Chitinophagales bacterium]MCZ2392394.1 MerC domain-containing protein [Chitinophagales bacterium]